MIFNGGVWFGGWCFRHRQKEEGADSGIDGVINFIDDMSGQAKRIRVQILTIAELLGGKKLAFPRHNIATLKQAERKSKVKAEQGWLLATLSFVVETQTSVTLG